MALVHQRGWDPAAYKESAWYFPIQPHWESLRGLSAFPSIERLNELYLRALPTEPGLPAALSALRFVAAAKKRRRPRRAAIDLRTLYEGRIMLCGEVPTRPSDWHDFFNALSFAAFPRAKHSLHARQFRLLAERIGPGARRLPGARTREQDALSLFDEGGIVLAVEPEALFRLSAPFPLSEEALALCAEGSARLVPFGHALYEHLVEHLACPLGTLHVVPLRFRTLSEPALLAQLDAALAQDLAAPTQFREPSSARGLALEP